MKDLEMIIREEIQERGPMTFARFMELALYHPEFGYYTSGRASIGRSGDFYTSPHMGPLFGRLVAESLSNVRDRLGDDRFSFIEMGAGEGWFARDFLEALHGEHEAIAEACEYVIVERSAAMVQKQKGTLGSLAKKVRWFSSIDELPDGICGVFFSNELVDALPFHRVRQEDDGLKELYVTSRDSWFREAPGNLSSPDIARYLNRLSMRLEHGQTTEVRLDACRWISDVARKLTRGFVITVDYGYPACDFYSPERSSGTIMCYHGHNSTDDPFICIGEQDITAHVEFTSICQEGYEQGLNPVLFTDQSSFLVSAACRVEDRLKDSRAPQEEFDALGAGLKPLVHPEWMGGAFKVLVQSKGVDASGIFDHLKNELKRLCECKDEDSFRMS